MIRSLTLGGLVAVAALIGGAIAAQAGYGCDRYGRSTDPNCYRGRSGVYVCGPCESRYRGRRWSDGDDWRPRSYGYGCNRYGRSTDPNCYRGPNRVYVCGPCYD